MHSNDKDYVYFDDDYEAQLNENSATNENTSLTSRNNFYKKHRAQNIRYKKTSPKMLQNQPRPHSASILVRNHTEIHKNVSNEHYNENALYSPSASSLLSKNPIDTLYEMSKNYKTVESSSSNASAAGLTGNCNASNSKSSYLTRSHTDVSSDPFNRRYQLSSDMDKMKPKTNLAIFKKPR